MREIECAMTGGRRGMRGAGDASGAHEWACGGRGFTTKYSK